MSTKVTSSQHIIVETSIRGGSMSRPEDHLPTIKFDNERSQQTQIELWNNHGSRQDCSVHEFYEIVQELVEFRDKLTEALKDDR